MMIPGYDGQVLSRNSDGAAEDLGELLEVPVYLHPLNMRPVPHVFHFMKGHFKRWPNTGVVRPFKKLRAKKQNMQRMGDLKEGEVSAAHALLNIAIASNVELEKDTAHAKETPILPQRDVHLTCMQPPRALDVFHQQQMPHSSDTTAAQEAFEHYFPLSENFPTSRKFGPFKLVPPIRKEKVCPAAICGAHQLSFC